MSIWAYIEVYLEFWSEFYKNSDVICFCQPKKLMSIKISYELLFDENDCNGIHTEFSNSFDQNSNRKSRWLCWKTLSFQEYFDENSNCLKSNKIP